MWCAPQQASMATTQVGNLPANAITVSRRIRRRSTILPASSSPTRLQLFFPKSTPSTAIRIVHPSKSARSQPTASGLNKGRAIHKGGPRTPDQPLQGGARQITCSAWRAQRDYRAWPPGRGACPARQHDPRFLRYVRLSPRRWPGQDIPPTDHAGRSYPRPWRCHRLLAVVARRTCRADQGNGPSPANRRLAKCS